MPEDRRTLEEQAAEALLPATLTPEQRARYRGVAAIVQRTVAAVAHATDEFTEPASVFVTPVRRAGPSLCEPR